LWLPYGPRFWHSVPRAAIYGTAVYAAAAAAALYVLNAPSLFASVDVRLMLGFGVAAWSATRDCT